MAFGKKVLDAGKKVGQEALRVAGETGERIIGHGPEVRFRHEIKEAIDGGTSKEQAEKEAFLDRINNLMGEISHLRSIDYGSENWKEVQAAMNELFEDIDRQKFIKDSDNPSVFKAPTMGPVSRGEYSGAESYFKRKFDGQVPKHSVINDSAESIKLINELTGRVSGLISKNARNSVDIRAILISAHPETGADIGKMYGIKELLEQAEDRFGREVWHKQEWEQYKKDAGESLKEMIVGVPVDVLGDMWKVTKKLSRDPSFKSLAESVMSLTGTAITAMLKELKEGGKLLYGGAKTTILYLNKLRK